MAGTDVRLLGEVQVGEEPREGAGGKVISPSYILRGARGWERDLQHLGRLRTSLNSMGKGDRLRQSYTTQLATEEPLRPISSLGCGFGREPKARSKTSDRKSTRLNSSHLGI